MAHILKLVVTAVTILMIICICHFCWWCALYILFMWLLKSLSVFLANKHVYNLFTQLHCIVKCVTNVHVWFTAVVKFFSNTLNTLCYKTIEDTLVTVKQYEDVRYTHSFYARQHICYSASMLWQFRLSVRLSVCPSVRPSVTRVDQSKTVEARITQFSPYSSPIPLVFRG